MPSPKFKVEFLEEAAEFLDSLDEKLRVDGKHFIPRHGQVETLYLPMT